MPFSQAAGWIRLNPVDCTQSFSIFQPLLTINFNKTQAKPPLLLLLLLFFTIPIASSLSAYPALFFWRP